MFQLRLLFLDIFMEESYLRNIKIVYISFKNLNILFADDKLNLQELFSYILYNPF